ncbi:MAG: DUF294 nucleotidyltransferase-like domain-containing protein [Thermoanaerobaculia bacterium]
MVDAAHAPTVPRAPREFLAEHAPFDRLPTAALLRLEDAIEIRFAAAGERLLSRGGAPADALWIVRKGRVRLEREGEALELLAPGECFGFPSLLGRRPPLRDAVAAEDCLLFRVGARAFRELLEEPGASRFFLDTLAQRLRLQEPADGAAFTPAATLGRRPIATIAPDASVEIAARRMRDLVVGSLLVLRPGAPEAERPELASILGIVTDRDLRDRVLAAGLPPSTPVAEVASRGLHTLPVGASSTDALLELARHGVRHLPLVDSGRVAGFVSASDLVLHQSFHPLALRREIDRLPLAELLDGYTMRLRRAVGELAASGVDAVRIGTLVAALGDRLAGRLAAAAAATHGLAPGDFAWIVHGSEGRREQILPTDQDNALAIRDAEGAEAAALEARSASLAKEVVDGLLAAGYPPCPGGYMATRWRHPLAAWLQRFERWTTAPRAEDALDFQTFLDARSAAGALDLLLLEEARQRAGRNPHVLRTLARDLADWALPVGLLGGLKEGEQGFDLKRGSLLIVSIARLAALEAGSGARGTIDRLAVSGPVLGADAATLAEGFRYLAGLRLELALDPARRVDAASGHRIHLASLNTLERRFLKEIFGTLKGVRDGLVARFAL